MNFLCISANGRDRSNEATPFSWPATASPSMMQERERRRTNVPTISGDATSTSCAAYPCAVVAPRSPSTGIEGCCPRARLTLAASSRPPPPTRAMNSRRLLSSNGDFLPHAFAPLTGRALSHPHSSLPQGGLQVLGANLKCSESRRWAAYPSMCWTRIAHDDEVDGGGERPRRSMALAGNATVSAVLSIVPVAAHPP
jgi:hypothetical protein